MKVKANWCGAIFIPENIKDKILLRIMRRWKVIYRYDQFDDSNNDKAWRMNGENLELHR